MSRRLPSLLPCSLAALVLLSGCGSSSGSGSSSGVTAAPAPPAPTDTASTAATPGPPGCRGVAQPPPRGTQNLSAPSQKLAPTRTYVVTLQTNCGQIQIQLDVKRAPKTTASFAYLVRRGFYDDLTFHRIAAGFVIQGGDPAGNGSGGPGYTIVEAPPADLRYTAGVVAMAKSPNEPSGASGSQFFIVTGTASLPPQYALVGHVISGMKAVQAIGAIPSNPPNDGAPTSPVVISRATLAVR